MLLECPFCESHNTLMADDFLNRRKIVCTSCELAIQFINQDGTPVFLKLSIDHSFMEGLKSHKKITSSKTPIPPR